MSPDSHAINQGIIQCCTAITRVLDVTECFQDVAATIAAGKVIKVIKPPLIPKGTGKLTALEKFKDLGKPKTDDDKKRVIKSILNSEADISKKKKDPLDQDKEFLKELVKELDNSPSKK